MRRARAAWVPGKSGSIDSSPIPRTRVQPGADEISRPPLKVIAPRDAARRGRPYKSTTKKTGGRAVRRSAEPWSPGAAARLLPPLGRIGGYGVRQHFTAPGMTVETSPRRRRICPVL